MIEQNEFDSLLRSYNLKSYTFNLIRQNKIEEATSILNQSDEILSYFIKFKAKDGVGNVILLFLGGWEIRYNKYCENEILEDLAGLKKEIEEKKNRLEEYQLLLQQKEFIELQKHDLVENRKDRKTAQQFNFILAFGVIVASVFNLFQIIVEFKKSTSLHLLIISALFFFFFILCVSFLFSNFNMKAQLIRFFQRETSLVFIVVSLIVVLFIFLWIFPDIRFT